MERRGWFGMSHLCEYITYHGPLFIIKKESPTSDSVAEYRTILTMEQMIRTVPLVGGRMDLGRGGLMVSEGRELR